jgi:AcrR family transcriptional regulator
MPRSGADARHRLQLAALELFKKNGFETTTAAGIAAQAGVTERTFFRHFADKREVLFDGEDAFREALVEGVREAPAQLAPMAALLSSFRLVAPLLEQNRTFSEPRRSVIARTPALQERLSAKTARLVKALSDALHGRGVGTASATLAAELGMAVLHNAANGWLDDPGSTIEDHLERAYAEMQSLTSMT